MKMSILITGGAGYLGSVLAEVLLDNGYNVTVFDNLMYKQTSLLHLCDNRKFTFIKGDVTNKKDLLPQIINNNIIIPLAAIVGAPACDANKDLATAINYEQIQFIVDNLRKGYTLGEARSRVSPFKLANFFSALEGITGSPYVLGDISAQVTKAAEDANAIDFEEFGDELKNKAINYFKQDEQEKLNTTSVDNFKRTVPSSVSDKILPQEKENIANQLDTMLASVNQSNIPLVPPATAVTPQSMISETILPNPKDRELAERLMANKSGIGGLG